MFTGGKKEEAYSTQKGPGAAPHLASLEELWTRPAGGLAEVSERAFLSELLPETCLGETCAVCCTPESVIYEWLGKRSRIRQANQLILRIRSCSLFPYTPHLLRLPLVVHLPDPQNTIFFKHETTKAKNLKCTNTETIKARINTNKDKSTCLRAVTVSLSEDVSDEEGYPVSIPGQGKGGQSVWALAVFPFTLSRCDWFDPGMLHTLSGHSVYPYSTCQRD